MYKRQGTQSLVETVGLTNTVAGRATLGFFIGSGGTAFKRIGICGDNFGPEVVFSVAKGGLIGAGIAGSFAAVGVEVAIGNFTLGNIAAGLPQTETIDDQLAEYIETKLRNIPITENHADVIGGMIENAIGCN